MTIHDCEHVTTTTTVLEHNQTSSTTTTTTTTTTIEPSPDFTLDQMLHLLQSHNGRLPPNWVHYCKSVLYNVTDAERETLLSSLAPGTSCLVITLNRRQNFNALSLEMVKRMTLLLLVARHDSDVTHIIIKSNLSGVFCAGGDVKALERGEAYAQEFFALELNMNRLLYRYNKPVVALLNGVTMGGGVGASVYCRYRVATDSKRFVFSMPENVLGFFTDIGSTFFLPVMCPSFAVASYVALIGLRLNAWDAKYCNLVTHVLREQQANSSNNNNSTNHHDLRYLEQQLVQLKPTPSHENSTSGVDDGGDIDARIQHLLDRVCNHGRELENRELLNQCHLAMNRQEIDHVYSGKTVETILERLRWSQTPFAQQATLQLTHKQCPTSVKVTLESMIRCVSLEHTANIEDALRRDYRLVLHTIKRQDFQEGVRSVLYDKTKKPQWNPSKVEDVDLEQVRRELFDTKARTPYEEELPFYKL